MTIIALDQGTTSSRAIRFNEQGIQIATHQQGITQHYPNIAWVEHDPLQLWQTQYDCLQHVLGNTPQSITAIGITNQRETTVIWERKTGKPIYPAIVWQDQRTAQQCDQYQQHPFAKEISQRTGLPIAPYFSASKISWILKHVPGAIAAAKRGQLAFGTIDTWLIWQLTQGKVHATDVTNASRTLLMNLTTGQWDQDLLDFFDIPHALLPSILNSYDDFGMTDTSLTKGQRIPIRGVAGDQQAALYGHTATELGQTKITYGTGCFLLTHTGDQAITSTHGLITTRAVQSDHQQRYALEGSVFMGGALIQWLKETLNLIEETNDIEALAKQVDNTLGVTIVPAFTGLGAPHWNNNARGTIFGLTRASTQAHLARACLEAIAWQNTDILLAMQTDLQHHTKNLTAHLMQQLFIDGGASSNNLLMQLQANQTGRTLQRPNNLEMTAWGAAKLAANLPEKSNIDASPTYFFPNPTDNTQQSHAQWQMACRCVKQYYTS